MDYKNLPSCETGPVSSGVGEGGLVCSFLFPLQQRFVLSHLTHKL